MISDPGLRYLLSALSLALIAAMRMWWRVRESPGTKQLSDAALWTSLSFSLAALVLAYTLLRIR